MDKNKGFTFIELLVAVFILIVGILGAYIVVQNPIMQTQKSLNQLTASYLAQEGIEIIKNIRDKNWLIGGVNWNDGLTAGEYEVDYNGILSPYNSGKFLNIQNSNGLYGYGLPGVSTIFNRKIIIENAPNPDDIGNYYLKVSILVAWNEKGKDRQVSARDNLYPWAGY